MFDTARRTGETETQYIWRICSAKDSGVLDITWDAVADILNKELRGDDDWYTSSAYRKKYQQAKLFRDEVFSKEQGDNPEYEEQRRELERLKVQYRDQRNSWNAQNRNAARVDENLNYLAEQLKEIGRVNFTVDPHMIESNLDNAMVLTLSDLHLGQCFDSCFGEFNSEIAKERLNRYLNKVIEIGEQNGVQRVFVTLLGDELSGNNHLSIQVSNRENLIDQIKLASEYITSFCVELSNYFMVDVYGIAGNHSRCIADKNKDIKDERLDTLITWIVKQMTDHIDNISVHCDNLDSTFTTMYVKDKCFVLTHGDMTGTSDSEISKLVLALGCFPYAILCGHKHTPMYKEFNNIKLIQAGSLASSGDDYTVTKRLTGKASQTVLIVNDEGIQSISNIELS